MKMRLLLLSILLISSPHLAAGMFDQLIQEGVNAEGKGIKKASGVTDRVTKSSLRDCDEKDNYWDNCYGEPVSKGAGYYGEYQKNMFNGQGTVNSGNGDKYVGAFKDNHFHGQATLTFANGDKYVGIYKKGLAIGQGTLTKRDGTVIVGTNVNGKFTPSTQDVKSAKSVPLGDLVKRDGFYYEKLSKYVFTGEVIGKEKGRIKYGKREGEWVKYHDNGNVSYRGSYKNGKEEGESLWYYRNGQSSDKGSYKNGKKEGEWVGYMTSGKVSYRVSYKNGKKEKKARIALESGPGYKLKNYYEAYFIVRACNDLNTRYISNSQLKKTRKAIRVIDNKFKKQGVDTDKVYKDAETNPSDSTNRTLAGVKTIKLLGAQNNYNQQLRMSCIGQSNMLILLAEGDKSKKQKGKKDF